MLCIQPRITNLTMSFVHCPPSPYLCKVPARGLGRLAVGCGLQEASGAVSELPRVIGYRGKGAISSYGPICRW